MPRSFQPRLRPHAVSLNVAALLIASSAVAQSPPAAVPLPDADAAFDRALPPLDALAPPPVPESAPAPVDDSPLAIPLPPIATFDATPAASTATTAAVADPAGIRYRVELSGFDAVGLEAPFRSLSALLKDGAKAANVAQIRARATEDEVLGGQLLRGAGYLDGRAAATIPATARAGEPLPVSIVATPGALYRVRAVTLTGLAPEPLGYATEALALKPGAPIAAQPVQDAEARVALRLPERGYPFVKVGQRDILLDEASATGDYTLPVASGPKAHFAALRAAGDPVFAPDHLAIFPRFKAGELYDSRRIDDLRQALIATGMFATVAVEPVRTGRVEADGTEAVDLLVTQTRGKVRTLAASAGYGTGEGAKVTGEYQNRNWSPPQGALIFGATLGTQQQSLAATFRRSDAGQRDRTFQAGASVSRARYDAFDAETLGLNASIARQSTPIWQKLWTYTVGAEIIASRETPFVLNDPSRPRRTYLVAALPLQGGYDRTDSLLDPTRGLRVVAKLSPEVQRQSGGVDTYARGLAEISGYVPLMDRKLVMAGRVRLGSIVGAARDDIAPSRRLYSGGGGSVRGFGYQQLGPKDANGDPVGGRSVSEFALEARYRFGNYGVVPFLDGGRLGQASSPGISGMRYGVGIGGRYYTNFGPFRIDIATPLGRRRGESKVALYFSIGQAF